jgi:hypothetical protein
MGSVQKKYFAGKTPDFTPAQLVAIAGAVIGVAVAAGLDISKDLQDRIIQLVTVLAPLLIIGDGVIRHGRSRNLGPSDFTSEKFK